MRLTSSAFDAHRPIPRKHTCEGQDIPPPLAWDGVPDDTASFALIVDDPDTPDPRSPTMTWAHWVVFDLSELSRGLPEGGELPPGARRGLNDWKEPGYRGPCPAKGRHRYFHKLYALDRRLELERPTKQELEEAMRPHVLREAVLIGTYEREARREPSESARAFGQPLLLVRRAVAR